MSESFNKISCFTQRSTLKRSSPTPCPPVSIVLRHIFHRYFSQVGIEKEKVNAENEAAKVEADKCAAIAREVMEKQASCERDLSAAEPLLLQAEAALDTLNKKVSWRSLGWMYVVERVCGSGGLPQVTA